MPEWILGISAFYHDSAAALLRDGLLVAAAQEERFTRKKHDPDFPRRAIAFCLARAGIGVQDLSAVGFYDKPMLKLERLMLSQLQHFPHSKEQFLQALPVWVKEKLPVRKVIRAELGWKGPVWFAEHHVSHAASSFLCSPFEEAAILTVDGVGEWATATQGVGKAGRIELLSEIRFPHSLGLLYSAFTHYLGFKVNSAEYKVMGLAPYGEPRYVDRLRQLIDIAPDGSFRLDMAYFDYDFGLRMTNERFWELLGAPPRTPEGPMETFHMDVARSLQEIVDEVMVKQATSLLERTGQRDLCLAGGVALNCVANGHITRRSPVRRIFVQPAAGDAGGALGVALWIHSQVLGHPRTFVMERTDWGPAWDDDAIEAVLRHYGARWERLPDDAAVCAWTAERLDRGDVVGWFQGGMEWGPRSLGHRSILGDPRVPDMRDRINLKIKFREGFRPFAPSVLAERAHEWFDLREHDSPFMLLVADVLPSRRTIPAVTHVDGSARIQTVSPRNSSLFHALLSSFEERTGYPMVINTSFNVRGEPIVCTPEDAFRCFVATHMDTLVMGRCILRKADQRVYPEIEDARRTVPLD
jgi:carbamoyltransferase